MCTSLSVRLASSCRPFLIACCLLLIACDCRSHLYTTPATLFLGRTLLDVNLDISLAFPTLALCICYVVIALPFSPHSLPPRNQQQLKSSLAASSTSSSTHTPVSSRPSTPLTPISSAFVPSSASASTGNPSLTPLAALAASATAFVPKSSSAAANVGTPTSASASGVAGNLSATSAAFNPGSAPFRPGGAGGGGKAEVSPTPVGVSQDRLREESYDSVDPDDVSHLQRICTLFFGRDWLTLDMIVARTCA